MEDKKTKKISVDVATVISIVAVAVSLATFWSSQNYQRENDKLQVIDETYGTLYDARRIALDITNIGHECGYWRMLDMPLEFEGHDALIVAKFRKLRDLHPLANVRIDKFERLLEKEASIEELRRFRLNSLRFYHEVRSDGDALGCNKELVNKLVKDAQFIVPDKILEQLDTP